MKIYILMIDRHFVDWNTVSIHGVYRTQEEAADTLRKLSKNKSNPRDEYWIEEHELI